MTFLTRVFCEAGELTPDEITKSLLGRHRGQESDYGSTSRHDEWGKERIERPEWVRQSRERDKRTTHIFPTKKAAKRFHADIRKAMPGVKVRRGRTPEPGYTSQAPYKPKVSVWPDESSEERKRSRAAPGLTSAERVARKDQRRRLMGLPKQPVTSLRRQHLRGLEAPRESL